MQRNEINLHLRLEGNSISFGELKLIDTKKPSIPLSNPKPPATPTPSQAHELYQEARRRTRLQKNPITIALAITTAPAPIVSEKPVLIYLIGAASFAALSKTPGVELFAVTMRDIEKALEPKTRTNPATVLLTEYHDYLDVFSQTEIDKLPPYRDADYKIELEPEKMPPYGPLYSIS